MGKIKVKKFIIIIFVLGLIAAAADMSYAQQSGEPVIIDHTCEGISDIPDAWIDSVQAVIKLHYAHTSHGGQLVYGLSYIESDDAKYSFAREDNNLPSEEGAFCIYGGQISDTYISTYEYWETASGMDKTRAVLDANPEINVSMWSWCTELNSYTQEQTRAYLDSISVLEAEYPGVTFVYMTGNAQYTGAEGYNRYLRNQEIRQHCLDNNRVLYDFADLDAWWYNPVAESWEQNTYDYGGTAVPVEHEQFNGDEAAHTTIESCKQKGRAVWWMAALIAGWDGGVISDSPNIPPISLTLFQNHPNPFNPTTTIRYYLPRRTHAELKIYDVSGSVVTKLSDGIEEEGFKTARWNGTNTRGGSVASGVYFYQLQAEGGTVTKKMILLR